MYKKSVKRKTLQKSVVWNAIQGMTNHPSAEIVFSEIRKTYPKIGRATIFRNLRQLSEENKIKRLHMPYSADCFDFDTSCHWHIQCSNCGQVADICSDKISTSYDTPESLCGYKVTGFTMAYEGLCPNCQK